MIVGKKKFFTLLSGATLHVAPNTKIIPREEFSDAMQAADLLGRVQEEIERYKEKIALECEQLKQQALQEGFQEGFAKWTNHLAQLEEEIANAHKATEKMIIPVALKAARKIVDRELELSQTAIVDIVSSKLKAVKQSKQVVIHVSVEDLQNIEKHRADLFALFESLESLSIRSSEEVKRGGCIIETESGIINAQIQKQWEILEQAFHSMMKDRL